MLPDFWPGYQGMSEPYLTVIPPLCFSGYISPLIILLLAVTSRAFFYWTVGDIKKHRGDWPIHWKLSKRVGLYSASEVHKLTKITHRSCSRQDWNLEIHCFRPKIKWTSAGNLTFILEFWNQDTNCFLISNEWALRPETSGLTDTRNAARLFLWYDGTHKDTLTRFINISRFMIMFWVSCRFHLLC